MNIRIQLEMNHHYRDAEYSLDEYIRHQRFMDNGRAGEIRLNAAKNAFLTGEQVKR